jgi:large exoprotein involved in heme utilization and adhesion
MNAKSLLKKAINLATLSSYLLWNFALAAPQGAEVVAGSASISQSGSTTTINQTSSNTDISWSGFNTAQNETVKFVQPNSSSIALNKIFSGQEMKELFYYQRDVNPRRVV